MTSEPRRSAANDNRRLRLANDGPTKEWLAERDAAGTSKAYRYHGGRIERALVNEASPLVSVLRQLVELMRPADIAATVDLGAEGAADDGANSGYGAERKHNQGSFLPSIPKLMAALADGLCPRVVSFQGKIVGRVGTTFAKSFVEIGGKIRGGFHGLQFSNGELVAYGDRGRKRRPTYVADRYGLSYDKDPLAHVKKDSPTYAHIVRAATDNLDYVELPAAERYKPTVAAEAPRSLSPPMKTRRAEAAAAMLSAAANDNVKIQKLPDGVAAEYGRLAGISSPKGSAATSSPRHHACDEIDRVEALASAGIGDAALEIVDAVLDGESFRTIGLRFGHAESSAHKSGRQIVERTLTEISRKIAA